MVKFAIDNYHKKVGYGICYEFVEKAVNEKNKNKSFVTILSNRDSMMSYSVPKDSIHPGDVLILIRALFSDSSYIENAHVGIITDFNGDSIIYASQNVATIKNQKEKTIKLKDGEKITVLKHSQVVYGQVVLSELISGEIIVCRF